LQRAGGYAVLTSSDPPPWHRQERLRQMESRLYPKLLPFSTLRENQVRAVKFSWKQAFVLKRAVFLPHQQSFTSSILIFVRAKSLMHDTKLFDNIYHR
jgi:hypothetical protein